MTERKINNGHKFRIGETLRWKNSGSNPALDKNYIIVHAGGNRIMLVSVGHNKVSTWGGCSDKFADDLENITYEEMYNLVGVYLERLVRVE